jgi:hypothetical protein
VEGMLAEIDILQSVRGGWALLEVKSATEVRSDHLHDVAMQLHVLRQAGVQVVRAEVMHLDPSCRNPELSNLFLREEVTARIEPLVSRVPAELAAARAMLEGKLPEIPSEARCLQPRNCPFIGRCRPEEKSAQEQQVRRLVKPALCDFLGSLKLPLSFLDVAAISPAVPRFAGCRPYESVPVRFSCHTQSEPSGGCEHHQWLSENAADPRPELAERILAACRDAGRVLVFGQVAEHLGALADAVPELGPGLRQLGGRLVDLSALFRERLGWADCQSLEEVASALMLEEKRGPPIFLDGAHAQHSLERLFQSGGSSPSQRAALRRDVLEYAAKETFKMVRILERLRAMAAGRVEV